MYGNMSSVEKALNKGELVAYKNYDTTGDVWVKEDALPKTIVVQPRCLIESASAIMPSSPIWLSAMWIVYMDSNSLRPAARPTAPR